MFRLSTTALLLIVLLILPGGADEGSEAAKKHAVFNHPCGAKKMK